MEPHDITYLQNDQIEEPESDDEELNLPRKKNLYLIAGVAFILLIGGSSVLISSFLKKPTGTQSRARSVSQKPTIAPTITQVNLTGEIVCADSINNINKCTAYAIKTKDNSVYKIRGVKYEDIKNGKIKIGEVTSVKGNLTLDETNQKAVILNAGGGSGHSDQNSNEVSSVLKPTATPIPTEIPHYKDSTPDPGVDYVNVEYIMAHFNELINKEVNIGAYLVDGSIGSDGCAISLICDYSIFVLADTNDVARDKSKDILMYADSIELEEDYTTGQNYYHKVKVIKDGELQRLDKVYQ